MAPPRRCRSVKENEKEEEKKGNEKGKRKEKPPPLTNGERHKRFREKNRVKVDENNKKRYDRLKIQRAEKKLAAMNTNSEVLFVVKTKHPDPEDQLKEIVQEMVQEQELSQERVLIKQVVMIKQKINFTIFFRYRNP